MTSPHGLLIARDELSGWLSNMDRPGQEGDRSFYLESWNGTGGYTFDRIARGSLFIKALCLSICGGIQPGKFKAYVKQAIDGDAGADGLLQRMQLLVWPDSLGEYKPLTQWPDPAPKNQVDELFRWLDNLRPEAQLGTVEEHDGIPCMRFCAEGQTLADEWRTNLEKRLRGFELRGRPAFAAHLAKYRSLMPSLALLFHLVHVFKGLGGSDGVHLKAVQRAIGWCDYLEGHAEKIYESERLNLIAEEARAGHV